MSIIEYDFSECERLSKVLNKAIDKKGFRNVLDAIGGILESAGQERIEETQESPPGMPWKAWSPAYAKNRHSGQKILFSTGNLRDSITHNVEGLTAYVGSNLVYARIHQLGGKAGRNNKVTMPARPYIGVSKQNEEDIYEVFANALNKQLRG